MNAYLRRCSHQSEHDSNLQQALQIIQQHGLAPNTENLFNLINLIVYLT